MNFSEKYSFVVHFFQKVRAKKLKNIPKVRAQSGGNPLTVTVVTVLQLLQLKL